MKTKTLISMAVASTFGWSAAAFAGTGHEVVTPYSPNESGENTFVLHKGFDSSTHMSGIGSISDQGGGIVSGSFSSDNSFSSFDQSASLSSDESLSAMDESLALGDQGIYSDYYVVSWTPVTVETWDVYVIDGQSADHMASLTDEETYTMSDQIAGLGDESLMGSSSFEMAMSSADWTSEFSTDIGDAPTGE